MSASNIITELFQMIPHALSKKEKKKQRRTKRRLARSLEKQIATLLELKDHKTVKSLIWYSINGKYQRSFFSAYSNSDHLSESSLETPSVLEKEEITEKENTDELFRNLSPIEKDLYDLIANAILKEMKHLELSRIFNQRTAQLCNSALCNGVAGHINQNVMESDITIVDEQSIAVNNVSKVDEIFQYKSAFYLQRRVVLKQLRSSGRNNSLLILAHELKLLSYLGFHRNIVVQLGLTEIDGIPSSMFLKISETDLFQYSRIHRQFRLDQVKWMVKNLTSAIEFLHSKNVILNNLTEYSICIEQPESVPVIVDFSCAYHVDGAKLLSERFQRRFAKTNHLPAEVLLGKRKPSFSSDIYSFGHLMSHFFARRVSDKKEKFIVENIALSLLNTDQDKFPQKHYVFTF